MSYSRPVGLKVKLVIFDLDQTLVDFISVHDEATRELFQKFFGVDARLTEIDFAGRSLSDTFLELAGLKGIPEDRVTKISRELLENYERIFGERLPQDASNHVLPGARRLLEELSKTDNFVVLYTGGSAGIVETGIEVPLVWASISGSPCMARKHRHGSVWSGLPWKRLRV